MSDILWPHGPQHDRPSCPSPTPGVYQNPCPLSRWCHLTISSCHPLLLMLSALPSIRVFSNESALLIRWPKYVHIWYLFFSFWLTSLYVTGSTSTSVKLTQMHFFFWLSNIPLYIRTTTSLFRSCNFTWDLFAIILGTVWCFFWIYF